MTSTNKPYQPPPNRQPLIVFLGVFLVVVVLAGVIYGLSRQSDPLLPAGSNIKTTENLSADPDPQTETQSRVIDANSAISQADHEREIRVIIQHALYDYPEFLDRTANNQVYATIGNYDDLIFEVKNFLDDTDFVAFKKKTKTELIT